jgi:hypothetical protein
MPSLPAPNSGSIAVADGSELSYQGIVTFDAAGAEGLKNPRIYVEAFGPDGDDPDEAPDLIYGEAGGAGDSFTLGGGWSKWVERGGGPAPCVASLFYFKIEGKSREWNGRGQQEYVLLAKCEFHAEG